MARVRFPAFWLCGCEKVRLWMWKWHLLLVRRSWCRSESDCGVVFSSFFFLLAPPGQAKTPRLRLLLRPPRESPDCHLTWSHVQPRIQMELFHGCQSTFFFSFFCARRVSYFPAQCCINITAGPYFHWLPVQMNNISRCVKWISLPASNRENVSRCRWEWKQQQTSSHRTAHSSFLTVKVKQLSKGADRAKHQCGVEGLGICDGWNVNHCMEGAAQTAHFCQTAEAHTRQAGSIKKDK